MNSHDAKFLLRAARPDGRDAADPRLAEAFAEADRDPQLRAWLERERALDTAVVTRLQAVAPPPELKQMILTGARASRPRPVWWRSSRWLAAAAGFAALVAVAALWRQAGLGRTADEFAAFAQRDLAEAHDGHVGEPPGLAAVQASLAQVALPLRDTVRLDAAELRQKHCRSVGFGGHAVFEICFQRDGTWFHLYAMSAEAMAPAERGRVHLRTEAGLTTAVWSKAGMAYALVSHAAPEAVRRLL